MITADKLTLLTNMPAVMLEQTLPVKGRPKLAKVRFLGITNAHEFCYAVVDTDGGEHKVFMNYDPTVDRVSATMG
jgi:hypothetical protein